MLTKKHKKIQSKKDWEEIKMETRYKSAAASQVIESYETGTDMKTSDLEDIVFAGRKPSELEQVRKTVGRIKEMEKGSTEVILETYGPFIGKMIAKASELGVYDIKKTLKKQLAVSEKHYATLDGMVKEYSSKAEVLYEKFDNAEDVMGNAGILLNRYTKALEDMRAKKEKMLEEQKIAKEKSAATPGDQTYNQIRKDIRGLTSDMRKIEYKQNAAASKVISQKSVTDTYNMKLAEFQYLEGAAQKALNVVDQRRQCYDVMIEQNISPITLMKVLGDVIQDGVHKDKVIATMWKTEKEVIGAMGDGTPKLSPKLAGPKGMDEIEKALQEGKDVTIALAQKILRDEASV
jgi:hypothetical protein